MKRRGIALAVLAASGFLGLATSPVEPAIPPCEDRWLPDVVARFAWWAAWTRDGSGEDRVWLGTWAPFGSGSGLTRAIEGGDVVATDDALGAILVRPTAARLQVRGEVTCAGQIRPYRVELDLTTPHQPGDPVAARRMDFRRMHPPLRCDMLPLARRVERMGLLGEWDFGALQLSASVDARDNRVGDVAVGDGATVTLVKAEYGVTTWLVVPDSSVSIFSVQGRLSCIHDGVETGWTAWVDPTVTQVDPRFRWIELRRSPPLRSDRRGVSVLDNDPPSL